MTLGQLAGQTKESLKFVAVPSATNVYEVIKILLEHHIHRVATVGEGNVLVGVLTDSRILRLLAATETNDKNHPFNKTLKELELVGNREPIWIAKDAPVIQAFEKMIKHRVRSVAVVEKDFVADKTTLCGQISASDLTTLLSKDLEENINPVASLPAELSLSVKEFLSWRDAVNPVLKHPEALAFAHRQTLLGTAVKKMVYFQIHKLFIVKSDTDLNIVGVLTLEDVLQSFFRNKEEIKP